MVDAENIAYKCWIVPKKSLHAIILAAASQSVRLKERPAHGMYTDLGSMFNIRA
jgi:hypothetical protein